MKQEIKYDKFRFYQNFIYGTLYPVYQLGKKATDWYDGYMFTCCDNAANCGFLSEDEIRENYVLFRSKELS